MYGGVGGRFAMLILVLCSLGGFLLYFLHDVKTVLVTLEGRKYILFLYTNVLLLHSSYYSFLPKLVCAHAIIIVPILVIYSITGPENVSTTGVQVLNEPAVLADLAFVFTRFFD